MAPGFGQMHTGDREGEKEAWWVGAGKVTDTPGLLGKLETRKEADATALRARGREGRNPERIPRRQPGRSQQG